MDEHNFCALLCSACSTTCCCIAVWAVESNYDFLRPICRNRLCISGLGISRQTGFNLEFPSPRWVACQGYEFHPTNFILYFIVQNLIKLDMTCYQLNATCGPTASDAEKIKCLFTSNLLLKTGKFIIDALKVHST